MDLDHDVALLMLVNHICPTIQRDKMLKRSLNVILMILTQQRNIFKFCHRH